MSYLPLRIVPFLIATCALVSCLSIPEPAARLPEYEVNLRYFAGDSISGPLAVAGTFTADPNEALDLRVELFFLDTFPEHALETISRVVTLHTADGGDPVRAISGNGGLARVGFGESATAFCNSLSENVRSLAEYRVVLPTGVALAAQFHSSQDACAVELARTEDALTPALVNYDEEAGVLRRTVSVLEARLSSGDKSLALIAPLQSGGALLWCITIVPNDESHRDVDAHLARFEACIEEVRATAAAVLAGIQPLDAYDLRARRLKGAVGALDVVRNHRPALVFLASQAGAPTAHDVAWLADEKFLGACVQRVLDARDDSEGTPAREQTAWRLERACYRELAAQFGNGTLAPELVSVLFRGAGELGRYPGLLDDVLVACQSQEELLERLKQENRLFLDDRNPASRVRAFDWLDAQGWAPQGYDPLASREERRAILAEVKQ